MEKERVAVIMAFSILIILGFAFYFLVYQQTKIQGEAILNSSNGTAIDPYGCLIHQGFTWNETEQACVREWIPQNQTDRYQKYFNASSSNLTSENQTLLNWTTDVNVTAVNSTSKNETNSNNRTLGSLINWSKIFS